MSATGIHPATFARLRPVRDRLAARMAPDSGWSIDLRVSKEEILTVAGVSLRFGGLQALDDVTLVARSGENRELLVARACGQLVHEQDFGLGGERRGEGDEAALRGRELRGRNLGVGLEADDRQCIERRGLRCLRFLSRMRRREGRPDCAAEAAADAAADGHALERRQLREG